MKLKTKHTQPVHLNQHVKVLLLSVLVGLCSGLAAVALKNLVHFVNVSLLRVGWTTVLGGNILMLLYPAVGILLTILFVKYVVKGQIGHGLPEVLYSISRKGSLLPVRNTYTSLIASTLTVAFGGSVGLEAPIASTGSAIGSNIGRLFKLETKSVRLLLGCGAAGAIAGIFKAPIAGVLFVVEVFMFDLTKTAAIPLLLSALSASSVAYFLMGNGVQFSFQVEDVFRVSQIPYYLILGVICALSSVYFLRVTDRVEKWMASLKSKSSRYVIGGILLGLMIFLFPPLFGEGYSSLTQLLNGSVETLFQNSIFEPLTTGHWQLASDHWPLIVIVYLLLLILLKAVATAVTIGSGGVGGTFGPSLIMGGLTGYFAYMLVSVAGFDGLNASTFALIGMAAVMTGVMQAPLMSTFLIAEITGSWTLMLPLLLTSAVTYICVNPFEKHSIYARDLAKHGDLLTHDKDASAWQLINMRELIETNFVIVRIGDTLGDLVEAIKYSKRNLFPVLDPDDRFVGIIVLDDVRKLIFSPELYDRYQVTDLMQPYSDLDVVHLSDSPQDVVEKFQMSNRYNLIVLDDHDSYVGFLSRANTFSAYRRFISESSAE
ncbi:MAG: chloride channel protein [Bacteroidales bacterium]|nr:chloride channel protein [Bacteroidales bacterium]